MSKDYKKTSTYSGYEAVKEFAKAAGFGIGAAFLGTATYTLVNEAKDQITTNANIAADSAGKNFDLTLKPLLSSKEPVSISSIEKTDENLATCLLRQNSTKMTILQNGSLESTGPISINVEKLRECYQATASAKSRQGSSGMAAVATVLTIVFGAGAAITGIASAGHLGGSAISGGQYLYRRRREKLEELAIK